MRNVMHGDIDRLLMRAVAAWESLPEVEREIDTWELEDQLVFVEEWPREEERLQQLAVYAREGLLDTAQQAEYRRLLALVEHNRPAANRLISA